MLKLVGKNWIRNMILYSLKISSHNIFINYQGKRRYCTVEKLGRHHLTQVIEMNRANRCYVPLDRMHWSELQHLQNYMQNIYILGEALENPNTGTFHKMTGLQFFENIKVVEVRDV